MIASDFEHPQYTYNINTAVIYSILLIAIFDKEFKFPW